MVIRGYNLTTQTDEASKDLIFIKRHYCEIYLELEDFFSLLMSEVLSKKAYDEYLANLMNSNELMESDIYKSDVGKIAIRLYSSFLYTVKCI